MTDLLGRIGHIATLGAALFACMAATGNADALDWQTVSPKDKSALVDAIAIGLEDGVPLYACRAVAGAGVHPGRFRNDFTGCHIGFGGQEISVAPFEVLTSGWQDAAEGNIPPHSFGAGERAQIGPAQQFGVTPLHSCRASYQSSIQVGEVARGDHGCSFGFGGRQVTEQKYQVLWSAPWMTWAPGIAHQIPPGAVVAGTEGGETFFVCRARDQTGLHPGKVKLTSPGCSIASDGKEIVSQLFSVLVPRWLAGNAGTLPVAALPAGHERQDLIYLCRTQIRNTVQIGKITEQLASCHVGMMGGEVASQAYDVLSEM